jgi:hypothetical protein
MSKVAGCHLTTFMQKKLKHILNLFFYRLNRRSLYNYDGSVPEFSNFVEIQDNSQLHDEKLRFWESIKNDSWCFKNEIIKNCIHTTELLAKSILTFLKQSFDLQEKIKLNQNLETRLVLHPFAVGITSKSSYTFNLCKAYYLNQYDLNCVMFENTSNMKRVSRKEYEFTSYKTFTEPHADYVTAFNTPTGQQSFGPYDVDLYSPKLNTVTQFYG